MSIYTDRTARGIQASVRTVLRRILLAKPDIIECLESGADFGEDLKAITRHIAGHVSMTYSSRQDLIKAFKIARESSWQAGATAAAGHGHDNRLTEPMARKLIESLKDPELGHEATLLAWLSVYSNNEERSRLAKALPNSAAEFNEFLSLERFSRAVELLFP